MSSTVTKPSLPQRLWLLVALAAATPAFLACGSTGRDCFHQVIDRSVVLRVLPVQACELEGNLHMRPDGSVGFDNSTPCQTACNDATINDCKVADDFATAFAQANPNATARPGPDASTLVCPAVPGGGATVGITCMVTHFEGVSCSDGTNSP
jgi:hypothetical protein